VGNVRVNDDSGPAEQGLPAIAVDPLGHALAVWVDRRGGSADIFSARLPAHVYRWGPNFRADDGPPGTEQMVPSLAVDHRGRAVAVWQDNRNGPPDIYWATLPPGIGGWIAGGRVNDVPMGQQINPDVVIDRQGTIHVVWEDYRSGPNDPDIYWASLPLGAGSWSASQRVNDDAPGSRQSHPALAVDRFNNLYAVWTDDRDGNPDIYFAKLSAGTSVWSPNVRVNDVVTGQQVNPDVVVGGQGAVHVVWEDYRHGLHDPDIYWAVLPAGASSWSPSHRVNDDLGEAPQRHPAIAVTRKGSVYAVWEDGRNDDGSPPPNDDIYFSLLRYDSPHWSGNLRVNTDQGQANQEQPAIAADWDGNGYVVWRDFRSSTTAPDTFFAFLFNPEQHRLYLPLLVKEE